MPKWREERKKGKLKPCGSALLVQSRGCSLRDSGDAAYAPAPFDRPCTGADLLLNVGQMLPLEVLRQVSRASKLKGTLLK